MRLEMRQLQSVSDRQKRQELVLGTQLGRGFVDDVDSFSAARQQARQDQGNRTADCEVYRVLDVLREFPEELLALLGADGFHDSPPQ
jgi:hypothetical protein